MDKAQEKIINWLQVYRDGGCKEEARIATLLMDDLEELGYCLLDRAKLRERIAEIIKQWVINNYPIGSQTFSDLAGQILDRVEGKK